MVQLAVFSCDPTGISVPENTQHVLIVHEIFRKQDGTTFLHRSRQLPKDACPRLARQVMRSYGFPAQGTDWRVLLVEIVDSRSGFAEEFTSSMAKQLVDGRGDESDDVRAALEVL